MGYLGRACGIKMIDLRYYAFSNHVLHGKLRKATIFFCERETWGVLVPEELATNRMGIMEETAKTVLDKKHLHEKNTLFYVRGVRRKTYFYSRGYYGGCGQIGCVYTFGEIWYCGTE